MSDYLNKLIARSRGNAETIKPRIASRFESTSFETPVDERSSEPNLDSPKPGPSKIQRSPDNINRDAASPVTTIVPPLGSFSDFPAAPSTHSENRKGADSANVENENQVDQDLVLPPAPFNQSADAIGSNQDRGSALADLDLVAGEPSSEGTNRAHDLEPSTRLEATHNARQEKHESSNVSTIEGVRVISQSLFFDRDQSKPAPPISDPSPVIRVSIGRIEVKAAQPQLSPPPRKPQRPRPVLSLDEYLNQRKGGQ